MPAAAKRAANILLDVVVATTADLESTDNTRFFELAISPLAYPETDLDRNIEDEHIAGAATICIAWLTSQLAQTRGDDLVDVVADLRTFLRTVGE